MPLLQYPANELHSHTANKLVETIGTHPPINAHPPIDAHCQKGLKKWMHVPLLEKIWQLLIRENMLQRLIRAKHSTQLV